MQAKPQRFPRDFTSQIFSGKTIARIMFNEQVASHCLQLSGKVLNLAGGVHSDYRRYLPGDIKLINADLLGDDCAGTRVDFNDPFPFSDNEFDAVLFFNAIYIAEDRVATLKEVRRVLKTGGSLYISSHLLYGEVPEPVDYCRLTYQGYERELTMAGFSDVNIVRVGERFTAAANLLHPFFIFNAVRFVVYGLALLLDWIIPQGFRTRQPAPLAYFCISRKLDIWRSN